jgi:K+-transporting ATPase KdpF subunit
MKATILFELSAASGMNNATIYIAGAIIAILIFGYLVYSLIRPEKF